MWRLYNQVRGTDLQEEQSFFRNTFDTQYNINSGFRSPRTDVCSTWISIEERLKSESDTRKRNELIIEKSTHRLIYKSFYKIRQDNREHIQTITFDCQKNQALRFLINRRITADISDFIILLL